MTKSKQTVLTIEALSGILDSSVKLYLAITEMFYPITAMCREALAIHLHLTSIITIRMNTNDNLIDAVIALGAGVKVKQAISLHREFLLKKKKKILATFAGGSSF